MNPDNSVGDGSEAAADVIRHKLDALYAAEPDLATETSLVAATPSKDSKHQLHLKSLVSSGLSQDALEKAWHDYYTTLPDAEKHQVWREFYATQKFSRPPVAIKTPRHKKRKILHPHHPSLTRKTLDLSAAATDGSPEVPHHQTAVVVSTFDAYPESNTPTMSPRADTKAKAAQDTARATVADIKKRIVSRVQSRQKLQTKQHVQSLLFGLGMGSLVLLIFMFGFFNERFIAPFITPSRSVSATPLIINANDTAVSDPVPKVIIPKINVEIPVVYDEPSVEEKAIQAALERGVVHYATTPAPGQSGNAVIFGHSSNNIFNKGDYKFAFVLLNRLEIDDTFYLTRDGVRYAYQVFEKKIVEPTAVEVLSTQQSFDTATLITCDPPGTTINRLVVVGKQISPDPTQNTASKAVSPDVPVSVVPSNAPSLWERITGWF